MLVEHFRWSETSSIVAIQDRFAGGDSRSAHSDRTLGEPGSVPRVGRVLLFLSTITIRKRENEKFAAEVAPEMPRKVPMCVHGTFSARSRAGRNELETGRESSKNLQLMKSSRLSAEAAARRAQRRHAFPLHFRRAGLSPAGFFAARLSFLGRTPVSREPRKTERSDGTQLDYEIWNRLDAARARPLAADCFRRLARRLLTQNGTRTGRQARQGRTIFMCVHSLAWLCSPRSTLTTTTVFLA